MRNFKRIAIIIILLLLALSIGSTTSTQYFGGATALQDYERDKSAYTAEIYDQSKESSATPISTDGWDLEEADSYRINAGDPPFVDGDYIDTFLRSYYPDSPLIGYGDVIKETADYEGISVGFALGVWAKETTFGRSEPGRSHFNFGCVMWTESSPYGRVFYGDRYWNDYGDVKTGIEEWFKLAGSYVDKGLITYKDFLDVYSPSFENDHSTFKNLMWGVMKSFGYSAEDTTIKPRKGKESKERGRTCKRRGGGSNAEFDLPPLSESRLSSTVRGWENAISLEMSNQGVDNKYLPILLGILQTESGGGGVGDIFQASESLGLAPNAISDPHESIKVGVGHFKNTLNKAGDKSVWAVAQGYNYGHAFLDYLHREDLDWNIDVAEEYAKTVVAPSLGNYTGETYPYINEISQSYGKPYNYWNGGNFHYVPMVMWYLGYSLDEIREMALNGAKDPNFKFEVDGTILFGKLYCQIEDDFDGGDIVEIALALDGYWTYSQKNRTSVLANIDNPNRADQTDCSGFTYFVYKKAGMRVPEIMWWTGAMQDDINGPNNYLQKISESETQAGDVVVDHRGAWSDHTAILLEPYKGPSTKIIQVGGSGGGVNQSTYGQSFANPPTSFGRGIPAE